MKLNKILEQKLQNVSLPGAAVAFDPDEAEELGAVEEDTASELDAIEAAFDEEV